MDLQEKLQWLASIHSVNTHSQRWSCCSPSAWENTPSPCKKTETKWLQWLNFITCLIPFSQETRTTACGLQLTETNWKQSSTWKTKLIVTDFGVLLITPDSFTSVEKLPFSYHYFQFFKCKKVCIFWRRKPALRCLHNPTYEALASVAIINCHSKDSKFT